MAVPDRGAGYKIEGSFDAGAGDSAVSTIRAIGTKYDVNAAGGADTKTNTIVVTVTPHDASNDTTTSDASTADSSN